MTEKNLKICIKCNVEKPKEEFYKNNAESDKLCIHCKKCVMKGKAKEKGICRFCKREFIGLKQNPRIYCSKSCRAKDIRIRQSNQNLQQEAHIKVRDFLKHNNNIKPEHCPLCNSVDEIQAHHDDYASWNLVRWMCKSCHTGYHMGRHEVSPVVNLLNWR